MNAQRQVLLGAFFLIVLLVLGVYTLFLTDFSLFKERHLIVAHFSEANGLRKGDSVLVAGIRDGRVQMLAYDPAAPVERRITVTLSLDHDVQLREGFDIFISDATVLGGKQVYIDPGPAAGAEVSSAGALPGRVKGGALDGLGRLVDENSAKLSRTLDDLQTIVADAKNGVGTVGRLLRDEEMANELREGVTAAKASFANIEALTGDIREGKGVLGRLATDEDLAGKFTEIAANLEQITVDFKGFTSDVQAGKGVLGRLSKDETLAQEVADAVKQIREISERINTAEGTLWKFLEDPELYNRVMSATENIEQSTIGKLISNDELYAKLDKVATDISAATGALRNAEGTLGKLVMDRALYDDVQRALNILTRTLEEYREAAPLTTFSSILFSGL
jgi:phospholipid/cholesterol/gamma-HCH transport system substrate-binding protein